MKRPVRIIVVGGNAAGPAAASKAKRFNPNTDVILFEASEFISTGTCEMPYVLSGEIDDYRKIVFFSPSSFQEEKGVKVFVKHLVDEIDTKNKQVVVKDLDEDKLLNYDYDKLILATGSKSKTLPGFDTQLKNVFTLKNVNDLIRLNEFISKEKVLTAIVIGSGYIGLEAVESLNKRNITVQLIEKESKPLPGADEEFGDEILKILGRNNIEFIGNVNEVEPVISGDRLLGVKLGDKFIETDLVLFSIGFEPDTYLARSAKLEIGKSGAIKVDRYLKTSDRFIYAAGDNVEVINAVTGKPDYIPLATHAYELGHFAGENAAGGNVKYDPFVKNITVKIFDKFFASVGLSYSDAVKNGFEGEAAFVKARNLVGVMPGSDYVFGKVLADKNSRRIIGGSFLGGKEVSGYADLLSALIKLKASVSTLSRINYNYTPPLSPFINLLSIIGKKFSENL
ncbi:MAG: FAD-dependent oxidoreductase [Ignavibacteriaceae bacterium]|nr:FAD-dependent oxidoreductase [Ignavibacteriaceae bacterium]